MKKGLQFCETLRPFQVRMSCRRKTNFTRNDKFLSPFSGLYQQFYVYFMKAFMENIQIELEEEQE